MIKKFFTLVCFACVPALVFAQTGFDSRINSITNMILTKIFPQVAILGLVYAAFLAATGDEGSKRRMVLVIIAVIIGFLAKFIIPMFQGAM